MQTFLFLKTIKKDRLAFLIISHITFLGSTGKLAASGIVKANRVSAADLSFCLEV